MKKKPQSFYFQERNFTAASIDSGNTSYLRVLSGQNNIILSGILYILSG